MEKNVMILGEGNYPFARGGVSTWCHSLCHGIKNVNFSLFSITAYVASEPLYVLSQNTQDIIQLPLWCLEDPTEIFNYHEMYYDRVLKIEKLNTNIIEEQFLPLLEALMEVIFLKKDNAAKITKIYLSLHEYFMQFDYKTTMYSIEVFEFYKQKIREYSALYTYLQDVSIMDVVFSLRWLYRFLLPISIELEKKDIYHVTMSGFPILPAIVCKEKYGSPIILTEHGVFIRERYISLGTSTFSYFLKTFLINLSESVAKVAYLNADVVVSVNEYNLKWAQLYGADLLKCRVIYNGVDEKKFKPTEVVKNNQHIVVAAARIYELKDIITMILTCNEVKKSIPNIQFVVFGDKDAVPEYTLQCETLIKELCLEANFILAGHHHDATALYNEGVVSILTSISEGFPYTIIESMSCGVPVVATDVGGVKEAIDNGIDGYVCKPKDYVSLANKVTTLLLDNTLRQSMSIKAREKVLKKFRLEAIVASYKDLYETVA